MVDIKMETLAYIGYIILAILILLLMITIHEFGHYLAGKIFKFKINEFSIGFGPKLFSKKKKNGEVFSIRAVPLGGYCAFAGEDEIPESDTPAGEDNRSVFEEEGGKAVEDKQALAQGVDRGGGSKADAARRGGVIGLAGSITGTVRESGAGVNREGLLNFNDHAPYKRIVVLMAGGVFNLISAILFCFIFILAVGLPQPKIMATTLDEAGNSYVRLSEGDIITHINGKATVINYLFSGKLDDSNGPETFFDFVLGQYSELGDEVLLTVRKIDGKTEDITLTKQLVVRSTVKLDDKGNPVKDSNGKYIYELVKDEDGNQLYDAKFGISLETHLDKSFKTAVTRCVPLMGKMSWLVLSTLGQLLTGQISCNQVSGPVGTVVGIADISSQYGWANLLLIMPLIAANLGVFNLLPVPALDGSKIIFTIVEWIRKKPVNRKVEGMIHAIGLLVLFGLVILLDISGLFMRCMA